MELHDKHNMYPLASEHVQVADDMLSPFQRGAFSTDSWLCTETRPESSQQEEVCSALPESSIVC